MRCNVRQRMPAPKSQRNPPVRKRPAAANGEPVANFENVANGAIASVPPRLINAVQSAMNADSPDLWCLLPYVNEVWAFLERRKLTPSSFADVDGNAFDTFLRVFVREKGCWTTSKDSIADRSGVHRNSQGNMLKWTANYAIHADRILQCKAIRWATAASRGQLVLYVNTHTSDESMMPALRKPTFQKMARPSLPLLLWTRLCSVIHRFDVGRRHWLRARRSFREKGARI